MEGREVVALNLLSFAVATRKPTRIGGRILKFDESDKLIASNIYFDN